MAANRVLLLVVLLPPQAKIKKTLALERVTVLMLPPQQAKIKPSERRSTMTPKLLLLLTKVHLPTICPNTMKVAMTTNLLLILLPPQAKIHHLTLTKPYVALPTQDLPTLTFHQSPKATQNRKV